MANSAGLHENWGNTEPLTGFAPRDPQKNSPKSPGIGTFLIPTAPENKKATPPEIGIAFYFRLADTGICPVVSLVVGLKFVVPESRLELL